MKKGCLSTKALVVLLVLPFVLGVLGRLFLVASYGMPTGSMAPTILGDHFEVSCTTCKYSFSLARRVGEVPSQGEHTAARCPLCGTEMGLDFKPSDAKNGAWMLVDKTAFWRSPLRRWDLAVFLFPQDPRKTFVKRVVGLPGETLRIDHRGDIVVQPAGGVFTVVRKPREVQEALWMPVYDQRFPDPRTVDWRPEDDAARWDGFAAKPGKRDTWVVYTHEIRDHYGYNPAGLRMDGLNEVGDLRVRASATPEAGATVRLALLENDRRLVAELPVGSGEVALLVSGTELARARGVCLAPGIATDVALAYADERATVFVAGLPVIEWDDPKPFPSTTSSGAALGCSGGARFADVRIDRDIYYTSTGNFDAAKQDVVVQDAHYFLLGDNSPNSMDCRIFGSVPADMILGRPFATVTPSLREIR